MSVYSKYADYVLLNLLKEDNQLAYTEIFERYSRILVNHAYKILGDQDEANDVVQEVLLSIWNKRHDLVITGSLSSYLYKATKNKILNHIAHEKVVSRYAESFSNFIESDYVFADSKLREKELEAIIEKEISQLPEKMREVFLLRKVEELSYDEIAQQLNITDKTAKQQVYNSLKILREKLKSMMNVFVW
ncbi:RNA polymerase sigma-70 factor (ECF subfamily) [Flavobacterium nitrogenifigens]|uniref:RNA polymerase sigma-70 factor (ECF subfamily) n=2 Tax=Flavobacterium TaxID=237 RepID=A0A7W7J1Q1_9FLAO|nr:MULTISPECIES: RNA polymerase sigma-70 factor [Flavobacterium]MBB4804577.1 RNA polymerase sigma-70 factor (ECF subfamily) [Flavobacterium nitrogenifigens]MBB6389536.1 RNA polymerase sigma-70 factor (ECF subfamily) [Flavobacterium notoginsengisoli]